jgi:hypothetical protein
MLWAESEGSQTTDRSEFQEPREFGILKTAGNWNELTVQPDDSIIIAEWYRRCAMPDLLIKDMPREVHEWLKHEAKKTAGP